MDLRIVSTGSCLKLEEGKEKDISNYFLQLTGKV